MRPWQVLRVAVRTLVRHKVRSFLTTLGIVAGIAAVIAMVAVGEGARAKIKAAFSALGTNLLILRTGASHSGGVHGGWGSQPTITWDDVRAIRGLSKVRRVAPRPEVKAQLSAAEANWSTDVGGVTPEFFDIRLWPIAEGRGITQSDVDAGTKVILLGQTVVDKLFGGSDPLGQTVRVGNVPFTVIGVLSPKGPSPWGGDLDDNSYVPLSTYLAKIQGGLRKYVPGSIYISSVSEDDALAAESQIKNLLRDRHHIVPPMEDDFQVRNMVEIAAAREKGAQTLGVLLASMAAVSLLIAGVGIMNIMLVSVTERTREIGLRLAVGARPRDILLQFLVEAVTLSLVGGIIGIALGVGSSEELTVRFGWPLLLSSDAVVAAVAVSAAVGVLFGLYPAWRAAALDPIEALRFES